MPRAIDCVSALSPAFDALYATVVWPAMAATEETLVMTPVCFRRISGSTCLIVRTGPLRFRVRIRSQFSSRISVADASPTLTPQLFCRMSMRP